MTTSSRPLILFLAAISRLMWSCSAFCLLPRTATAADTFRTRTKTQATKRESGSLNSNRSALLCRGQGKSTDGQETGDGGSRGGKTSSDRLDFVKALATRAGAAAAILVGDNVQGAWGVGLQPGERETEPPPQLLLVPALRAKVCADRWVWVCCFISGAKGCGPAACVLFGCDLHTL